MKSQRGRGEVETWRRFDVPRDERTRGEACVSLRSTARRRHARARFLVGESFWSARGGRKAEAADAAKRKSGSGFRLLCGTGSVPNFYNFLA